MAVAECVRPCGGGSRGQTQSTNCSTNSPVAMQGGGVRASGAWTSVRPAAGSGRTISDDDAKRRHNMAAERGVISMKAGFRKA